MKTMDGALDSYFEEQITSTLENLMSEENIDEEGQAFIEELKEGIDIIRKLHEDSVPEEEKGSLILRLASIQLMMLDYSLSDRRKRISPEDLPKRLEEIGVLNTYKRWNEELTEHGFVMNEVIEEDLKDFKTISYRYSGDFSVQGDHAVDVFGLHAELSENGLMITYCSSNLTIWYLGYWDDETPMKHPERLPKVQAFLDKNRDFIDDYHEDIKLTPIGCFQVTIDNKPYGRSVQSVQDSLIKLGVILDRELQRRYPFEIVRDYEVNSQTLLSEIIEAFKEFDPSTWDEYHNVWYRNYLHYDRLRDVVIRSSYRIKQDEVIEKFSVLAMFVWRCQRELEIFKDGSYEERICPYAKGNRKVFCGEEQIRHLIEEIKKMTPEEFENYKDRLFDL